MSIEVQFPLLLLAPSASLKTENGQSSFIDGAKWYTVDHLRGRRLCVFENVQAAKRFCNRFGIARKNARPLEASPERLLAILADHEMQGVILNAGSEQQWIQDRVEFCRQLSELPRACHFHRMCDRFSTAIVRVSH